MMMSLTLTFGITISPRALNLFFAKALAER